jgi:glycosyltransferase involved in cell wall biosynthesis
MTEGARKLLILHDSPDFGGHERMLMELLPGLFEPDAPFDDMAISLPASNTRLQASLARSFPSLRQIPTPFTKRRGEPYFRHMRFDYRRAVRQLIAIEHPDTVLLVQGRIENLAVPLSVIDSRTRVVSYLPMAHRMSEMGRNGALGDRVRRPLYQRPDQFIVPSETVAEQLARAGSRSPVAVAHNVVSPPPRISQSEARNRVALPGGRKTALFIGRLCGASKGIDLLMDAVRRADAGQLHEWIFVFVGKGPERDAIKAFAEQAKVDLRLIPWTDKPEIYMAAADIVLLPSRWEGVPLVMLEAMQYGIPILASGIDVYRQYLPHANICDYSTVDLAKTMQSLTRPDAIERFAKHAQAQLAPMTIDASRRVFTNALAGREAA